MVILAIDLAWSGKSGWVLFYSEMPDPVTEYGEFKPKIHKEWKGTMRDFRISKHISDAVSTLLRQFEVDYVVYEITDWHKDLKRSRRFSVDYKIERQTQRTLGKASVSLLNGVGLAGLPMNKVVAMGANEAKQAFGAQKKRAAAELFASEYPSRFDTIYDDDEYFIYDTKEDKKISNHISDAFVLAAVAARELHKQEMVNDAA